MLAVAVAAAVRQSGSGLWNVAMAGEDMGQRWRGRRGKAAHDDDVVHLKKRKTLCPFFSFSLLLLATPVYIYRKTLVFFWLYPAGFIIIKSIFFIIEMQHVYVIVRRLRSLS